MTESTEGTQKKRGVKKGTKRPHCYVHAAVTKDGKLAFGMYEGSKQASAETFEEEFGIAPEQTSAPVYEVKGKKAAAGVTARDSIRLNTADLLNTTQKKFAGEYKGWKVLGNGIKAVTVDNKQYKANELMNVIFDSPINPEEKPRKPRLATGEVLPVAVIENLTEI